MARSVSDVSLRVRSRRSCVVDRSASAMAETTKIVEFSAACVRVELRSYSEMIRADELTQEPKRDFISITKEADWGK